MKWQTLQRRTLLAHSRYLTVEEHTVQLPDGSAITNWPWLVMPDYVDVVAVTRSGDMICLHQGKYAIEGESLAPVGGFVEPGEDVEAAARRELLEETGYTSNRWHNLGAFAVDGNRGAGTAYMFLAEDCTQSRPPSSDDLEDQELVLVPMGEVRNELLGGQFKVLPWATAVALALLHLG